MPAADDSRHRWTRGARAGTERSQQLEDRQQRDRLVARRHRRQAESRRDRTARRDAAATEIRVLRPPPDREAERLRVLQRAQQHLRVGDRHVRLREADATGVAQLGHLGQRDAGEPDRQRAERMDVRAVQRPCAMLQHLDQPGLVERRIGVGRTDQRRHAAGQRRVDLRLERRAVFGTRLAQPRRQVDEARDRPRGRPHRSCGRRLKSSEPCACGSTTPTMRPSATSTSRGASTPRRRIEDTAVADRELHGEVGRRHAAARMLMTAIRIAMPNVTCGRITLCEPSATDDSISTPRFIGPGCMTIASGAASASFSAVSP